MSAFPRKSLQPIAIAAALAFVYFTMLVKLANDWWHDEHYSHGLLIPFVIAFMLWQERGRLSEAKRQTWTWIGAGGIALSLFMLWAGTAGAELFVQRISLVQANRVEILLGSGSLANDAVGGQISLLQKPGLILSNGEFGDRLVPSLAPLLVQPEIDCLPCECSDW